MTRLTATERRHLRTYILEIATEIAAGAWRDEGDWRRFTGYGGLLIHRATGAAWCASERVRGPFDALRRLQADMTEADSLAWCRAYLAAHSGAGSCDPAADLDDGSEATREYNTAKARDAIERSVPITPDTTTWTYLAARGLDPSLSDRVRHLPHARNGDDGMLVFFGDPTNPSMVQLTYIDGRGAKSTVAPQRRGYRLTDKPHILALPGNGEATVVVEGAEDALSTHQVTQHAVIGIPGIGELANLPTKPGRTFIIARDGDPPGSAADKALWRGVDALILQGARVRVTATPEGRDANDILAKDGADALAALIANATTDAELTDEGEIERIRRMDRHSIEREQAVWELKRRRKLSVGFLRKHLRFLDRLDEASAEPSPASASSAIVGEPDPWPEPVNLGDVLDQIAALALRFLATSDPENITVLCLWITHTHLMHHQRVSLGASPRLYVAGAKENTGKSTTTDIAGLLMPRTMVGSDLTGPALFRSIEEGRHSLVIHQANTLFRRDGSTKADGLASVLNSGHRRREAIIRRVATLENGSLKVQEFSSWAPMAIDGIRFLPTAEMRSRCIELWMHPATEDEASRLLDLDQHEALFTDPKRQLTRWADDLTELDLQPPMPTRLYNRVGLNWRILFAIAHAAGGQWIDRVQHAAKAILNRDSGGRDTIAERLLASVHFAFEQQAKIDNERGHVQGDDNRDFLRTSSLIAHLLADPEEQWARANRGHPIDAYFLREQLKMLITRDTKRLDAGRDTSGKRLRPSGYYRHQFVEPWHRYLGWIEQPITACVSLPPITFTAVVSIEAHKSNGIDPDPPPNFTTPPPITRLHLDRDTLP